MSILQITQIDLILSYFTARPNTDIPHAEVVDWAVNEWKRIKGEVFRDPDRAIRSLYGKGLLTKVTKGVYRYEPDKARERNESNFTTRQKEEIFKRDEHKCVICGRGVAEGQEIHADHIKPRQVGGESTLDNGQTLCGEHNYRKKAYKQTETGKKMFIRLYELSRNSEDKKIRDFCHSILKVYEEHDINGHIEWEEPL